MAHDPRKLCRRYLTLAKRWWAAVLLCKACLIVFSAVIISFSVFSKFAPFVALAVTLSSEFCQARSDKAKSIGELLLRKLDYLDAFGWQISKAELSDVFVDAGAKMRKRTPAKNDDEKYFASKDPIGTQRALENIQESAWWTKHLAHKMFCYLLAGTVTTMVLAIVLLIVTVGTVSDFQVLAGVGRVVMAVVMLIVSLGLVRLTNSYYQANQMSQHAESRATELMSHSTNQVEVIKLYSEYHLNRATAPLIPNRMWKWNRETLNELWNEYRAA